MNFSCLSRTAAGAAFTVAAVLAAGPSSADMGHGSSKGVGHAGEAAKATRTVEIVMHDNFYEPEKVDVKAGETVRFTVRNNGELVHEFNIGTADMHRGHQKEMMMMVEHGVLEPDRINHEAAKAMQADMGHGMHNDPNSVLLEPGKSGEVVWTFPEDAVLEFACNVPGHYEAGMQGQIMIKH
ncbi:cupredoxin domain-containing protein [Oceanibacterium hippocampi]|uniref:Plastocyanin n=1 Tax=Oceanibacterium hippocampi TaxID=745714 RepID=A0A1Y5TGD3_9PROT|nr:cupredoxin domain-containing protein [Oceanibacterium hippocampi]SLN63070.1 Plastocyanin [Oceanibacterium hippocampi]